MTTVCRVTASLALFLVALDGWGCATARSSRPEPAPPTSVEVVTEERAICPPPEWYTDPPPHPRFLIAPATAVSQDLQMAYDKAILQARAEIGRQLEAWAFGVQDLAVAEITGEQVGPFRSQYSAASRLVVRQSIEGSGVVERTPVCRESTGFRAYVLVAYSMGLAKSDLFERLRGRDGDLFRRFEGTEVGRLIRADIQAWDPNEVYVVR